MIRYLLSAALAAGALVASPVVPAQAALPAPVAGAAPAVIADTSVGDGNRGAIFFYVGEIDGAQPATDAERMSGRLSFFVMPRGFTAPADVKREVEPGLRRLLLVGKHASNDLTDQHEEYAVVWGPDGRVQSVESGDDIALLDVLHKPR